MNREYAIIAIAMGEKTAEKKERIKEYQADAEQARKEGRKIIFYAPDDD